MAATINGYIARPNGDEDFLSHENWETAVSLAKEAGNIVVGRKTYELVRAWKDGYNLSDIKGVKKIVVSSDPKFGVDDDFILAESPETTLAELKNYPVGLLVGGGTLNASFATKDLIDEVVLNVEPAVIGNGRQLFAKGDYEMRLELVSIKKLTKGLIQLHYMVKK